MRKYIADGRRDILAIPVRWVFFRVCPIMSSCYVHRYFVGGGTVVARAIRGVCAGEEVCENYGPLYTRETREPRRSKLREQYWFECGCEACEEDWPTFDTMPDMQQVRDHMSLTHR